MLLETGTASQENYFSGTVTIYLENGQQLTCSDQNIRDYVEQKSRALYNITSDQVYHLKESNITRIKYTINPEYDREPNAGERTADAYSINECGPYEYFY